MTKEWGFFSCEKFYFTNFKRSLLGLPCGLRLHHLTEMPAESCPDFETQILHDHKLWGASPFSEAVGGGVVAGDGELCLKKCDSFSSTGACRDEDASDELLTSHPTHGTVTPRKHKQPECGFCSIGGSLSCHGSDSADGGEFELRSALSSGGASFSKTRLVERVTPSRLSKETDDDVLIDCELLAISILNVSPSATTPSSTATTPTPSVVNQPMACACVTRNPRRGPLVALMPMDPTTKYRKIARTYGATAVNYVDFEALHVEHESYVCALKLAAPSVKPSPFPFFSELRNQRRRRTKFYTMQATPLGSISKLPLQTARTQPPPYSPKGFFTYQ